MSEQPPNQWGQNPYEQPQQNQPTQPLGGQQQWGAQPGQGTYGQQQWGNQPGQGAYGQQHWGQGPGGPGGPGGPVGPGGPGQPGGNKKTIWLVLAAVLVLVAAGVVVAVLLLTGDDDDSKSDSDDDRSSSATTSDSASASESASESPTEETSGPEDPTTSASAETSSPVDGGNAVFVFPDEVDGRTLDSATGGDGPAVGPDTNFASATYKGSEMADMMIYQYMKSLDAKTYAEATDNPVKRIGDAYCAKVLDSMEAYACAVDYEGGVLFTSSNMTTVTSPEDVAATLQEMVKAIG